MLQGARQPTATLAQSVGLRADGKEEEAGDFADGLKGKREARARPSRKT